MRRFLGVTTGILSYVILIFVLNPLQMLSVVLYPFSPRAFRAVNRSFARFIWGWWVLLGEVQSDCEMRFVGDRPPWRENALVIANHQTMADVLVVLCMAWRVGRVDDLKFFVKDMMKWVPGPGWGMRFLDCVFVKRDWTRDKAGIERIFRKYKEENIPILLVSFLEGTRQTPEKLARSQAYARERGLYVPQHTMVPRTKGFVASLHGLRGHIDAVYDLTIGYPDGAPTLVSCYQAQVDRVEIKLRRYPVDELPTDEEALTAWVFERYHEKDLALARLRETGRLEGEPFGDRVRFRDWLASKKRRPGEAAEDGAVTDAGVTPRS